MRVQPSTHSGFTLVELMVVVLIIGILVTIAVPVFTRSRLDAEIKACQANQRTIQGAVDLLESISGPTTTASAGEFASGGSSWYGLLVPGWIRSKPTCPVDRANYYMAASGEVIGDRGPVQSFGLDHYLP